MTQRFSISEDLQFRSLDQSVEILWISGSTRHDAKKIARVLEIDEDKVNEIVQRMNSGRAAGRLR